MRRFVQEPFTLRNLSASTRCFITGAERGLTLHQPAAAAAFMASALTYTHSTLGAVEINSVWNLFCTPPTYIPRLRTQTRPLAPIESAPTQHTKESQKAFCAVAQRGWMRFSPRSLCWQFHKLNFALKHYKICVDFLPSAVTHFNYYSGPYLSLQFVFWDDLKIAIRNHVFFCTKLTLP
jgi:hypothetical protein